MNASHLMGMAALCMLSACVPGNREINNNPHLYSQPLQSQTFVQAEAALVSMPKEEGHTREHLMAYGQLLSFWAGQLK